MAQAIIGSIGGFLSEAGDWVKTRFANLDIFDEHYQTEAKTNPFYALGSIFYLIWFIVMATGCLLIMWYIPTKPAAFDSILRIQESIPFGGIIRGMHKYGADAMIIAATMRMYRMFMMADYKPGKEFNVAVCFVSLLLAMYSGLTGYLLIWNQRAYWATKVFATFPTYMDQFPLMGDYWQPLVKSMHMGWNTAEALLGSGAAITQETITRFFSIHLAFSLIPLILVELYFYKNAQTRISLSWLKRSIVILMLVAVAVILPAAQGRRSDPNVTPLPILSDWYFLGLYQMYKYLEPVVATEITMLIPLSVVSLPFLDSWITGSEKDIWKRPLVLTISLMGMLCWIVFSFLIIANIANIHNDPPYWRLFLYTFIDLGIIWQLFLMLQNSDIMQKIRGANGALIMAAAGAVQTGVAIAYYFMARTEMFLSPVGQGFVYLSTKMLTWPFAGKSCQEAEGLVSQLIKVNPEYWNFNTLIDAENIRKMGAPAGEDLLRQLAHLCHTTTTPIDFIFQLIPTFTPAPHACYSGMLDFMVNNRWLADFIMLSNRLTPNVVAPYPVQVPDLDLLWMFAGPLVMLFGLYTWFSCKRAKIPTVKQAQVESKPLVPST